MKQLILFLTFFFSLTIALHAYDYIYLVEAYKDVPGMDYQLEIVAQKEAKDHQIFVDCQSFFNGIYYRKFVNGDWENIWSIALSGNDCENIVFFTKDSIDKRHPFCLFVNPKEEVLDFSSEISGCSQ